MSFEKNSVGTRVLGTRKLVESREKAELGRRFQYIGYQETKRVHAGKALLSSRLSMDIRISSTRR